MGNLNEFGPGPYNWQQRPLDQKPPKKSHKGVIALASAIGLVGLALGFGVGLTSGNDNNGSTIEPTVVVTETATPKPAPTVTVTARPNSDEPKKKETHHGEITSAYDIEADYQGCTWLTDLDQSGTQVIHSDDCQVAVAYSETDGLALESIEQGAGAVGYGYVVYTDKWAAWVSNSADSAALSQRYGASVEEV